MELILILFLILLNGFFAMTEIAVVASRKSKLQQMIADGKKGAKIALELAQNPDKFFPTIQVGITLVTILAGAIGEATLTTRLSQVLEQIPIIAPFHAILAFILIIGGITYVSLVIGELVPKHVAISNPEGFAAFSAPFMKGLLTATFPLVRFLSFSSEMVLRLLGVKKAPASSVSGDEVKLLMTEGQRAGIFNLIEKRLVDRILELDNLKVGSLMTPREAIQWLDINNLSHDFKGYLSRHKHSRIILGDKTIDNLIGIVHVKDFLNHYINDPKIDIKKHSQKPHVISEDTSAIKALELFRKSPMHLALIVDEYGKVCGLVTFNDVLAAVVGEIQENNWSNDAKVIKRSDNSFLFDGMLMLNELRKVLKLEALPKDAYKYLTLGGFVIARLGKIPTEGDKFEWEGYGFEVIDMDGNRVDKVLAIQIPPKKN